MSPADFALGILLGTGAHSEHAAFDFDTGRQRGQHFVVSTGPVISRGIDANGHQLQDTNFATLMFLPARVSETYVFRTYPFRESDLIVSFFTRDQGKLRGVARRARKPKSSFGSGLERLSLVNLSYSQKENRELVNLNSCDLVQSQFDLLSDFEASVALDYIAEVSDHLLPANEPNERFFRLLAAVLDHMHGRTPGAIWTSITYFSLWATRLSGFLPDLTTYHDRNLTDFSRDLSGTMLRHHIAELPALTWTKDTALDLRRILIRKMEEHVERRFHTPALLEGL